MVHTIIIGKVLTSATFKEYIRVPFTPKRLIVRNVDFYVDGTLTDSYRLRSTLCTYPGTLCIINAAPSQQYVNSRFDIPSYTDGEHEFTIIGSDGQPANISTGNISVHLEFW